MSLRSISVEFWSRVFFVLGKISVFAIVYPMSRKALPNKQPQWWYDFVDVWVLGHLALSIISVVIVNQLRDHWLSYVVVAYGLLRVFEVIVYQVNVLLFDEYRAQKKGIEYRVRAYRRMVVNLFNNFAEIVFWFASSYILFSASLTEIEMTVPGMLFNSFSVMTTFGVSDLKVRNETGLAILWFQSMSGLLMTLLSISRFIGMLPKSPSMDETEN